MFMCVREVKGDEYGIESKSNNLERQLSNSLNYFIKSNNYEFKAYNDGTESCYSR